jgi:hypothetical protein
MKVRSERTRMYGSEYIVRVKKAFSSENVRERTHRTA